MRIGWVGLGKLGLPIAEEIAKTHDVVGLDIMTRATVRVQQAVRVDAVNSCDLIFVAVPTPHGPEYEGVTRLPETRADFDYSHLTAAVGALAKTCDKRPPLVIVSTVLPGTIEREILPLWDGPVLYNPFFIAMGEEVADFLDPEFVLLGAGPHTGPALSRAIAFYRELGVDAPVLVTQYRAAELAKMAYNTFVGLKIAFANTIGELSDHLGVDADAVLGVLKHGSKRIVSTKYLDAGMGDGGPCHPRDNIALSWLARECGMSFDLFGALMEQRERHAEWLALRVRGTAWLDGAPVTVLGRAYKPGTELETGSPALLVAELLREHGVEFDHVEDL